MRSDWHYSTYEPSGERRNMFKGFLSLLVIMAIISAIIAVIVYLVYLARVQPELF